MKNPKFETPLALLSGEDLMLAIEDGQRNLSDLLVEVEKNPNPETREGAREQAHQQLEAILSMLERKGGETRKKIAVLKEEADTSMDPERFIDPQRQ